MALDQERWNNAFKFTFIRNPWDRAVSLFMHQTKGDGHFKDWLLSTVEKDGHPKDRRQPWKLSDKMHSTGGHSFPWKSQTDWLVDNNGKINMDFIGRYETLDRDFKAMCEMIGVKPTRLPVINKSDHYSYQSYYDPECKEIVASWHRHDIVRFNYKFEFIPLL